MKTRKLAPIHPGETAELWTGLQADYDLRLTRYEKQSRIELDVEPLAVLQTAMV
jgi:plasmid maintenance system antidote protein VapI